MGSFFSSTCCCAGFSDIPKHVLASVVAPELTTKLLSASRMWRKDRRHDGGVHTVSTSGPQIYINVRLILFREKHQSIVIRAPVMSGGRCAAKCNRFKSQLEGNYLQYHQGQYLLQSGLFLVLFRASRKNKTFDPTTSAGLSR